MRKDAAFARSVILATLPGHFTAIVTASGYAPATVSRHLAALVAEGKAYQLAWRSEGTRVTPVYALGSPPMGFKLPPKPELEKARKARQKRNRRLRDPEWKAAQDAKRAARRPPKGPAPPEVRKAAASKAAKALHAKRRREQSAFANSLFQLTLPKSVDE